MLVARTQGVSATEADLAAVLRNAPLFAEVRNSKEDGVTE